LGSNTTSCSALEGLLNVAAYSVLCVQLLLLLLLQELH
jgi:hypothetical protein